jgi:hypothetical protein
MQSLHLCDDQWLESIPSHQLPTQQNNDRFCFVFYFLQTAQHMRIWVDIHVN